MEKATSFNITIILAETILTVQKSPYDPSVFGVIAQGHKTNFEEKMRIYIYTRMYSVQHIADCRLQHGLKYACMYNILRCFTDVDKNISHKWKHPSLFIRKSALLVALIHP